MLGRRVCPIGLVGWLCRGLLSWVGVVGCLGGLSIASGVVVGVAECEDDCAGREIAQL